MRVTFILPPVNMSGGIRVAAVYAEALARNGHQVTLVSPAQPPIKLRSRVRSFLSGEGWPRNQEFRSHLDGRGLNHRVLERYRPVMDEDVPDADIVIATWWETAEWVNALSRRKGEKIYFVQHHEVFELFACRTVQGYVPDAVAQDCNRSMVGRCNAGRVW